MDTTTRNRLAATLTLAACGGDGSDSGASTSSAEQAPAAQRADPRMDTGAADGRAVDSAALAFESNARAGSVEAPAEQAAAFERSVISTGMVSLLGADVAQARFDVQKIVDAHSGEIAEEKTQTDEDGAVSRSRLVVRIPVAQFDEAMEELEAVARLESSSRSSEDVTTEVIDTEVRIRAQSKSLERVEVLLARATSIRDIVAIEAQLTRRQAELDSLKARQAYLADQTSMSTITVFLQEIPPKQEKQEKAEKDESGFLAGLSAGWSGMKSFLVGAATVVGAVLPFAVMFVILGVPLWLVARSRRAARWVRRGDGDRTPETA
jgi:hypothetical protein